MISTEQIIFLLKMLKKTQSLIRDTGTERSKENKAIAQEIRTAFEAILPDLRAVKRYPAYEHADRAWLQKMARRLRENSIHPSKEAAKDFFCEFISLAIQLGIPDSTMKDFVIDFERN